MQNVEHITYQDKDIYLIKTAHVSKESVNEVHQVIEELKPDVICVELDKGRYESLLNPEAYKQMDIIKIIKEKRVAMVLVNLILSSYQKRMANKLDVNNGDEMRAAIEEAKERNIPLVLADRNIQTTFTRVWRAHTFTDKIKLIGGIISACFDDEELTEEDLDMLKQTDMLTAALNDITKEFPKFAESLIFERDRYLTAKIREANGKRIVAVIGAAHSIGIKEHINDPISIEELDRIPPKSLASKISGWIIPTIIILLILSSFHLDTNLGWEQIKSWFLWNGTLSALGTALVLGHPLSILTAFLAAPFTSLNPLIAAGWFAGLTEAYVRKPRVMDLESLNDDINSFKGIMHNRFIRILLVVIMANVFSSIATYISGADIIKNIISHM